MCEDLGLHAEGHCDGVGRARIDGDDLAVPSDDHLGEVRVLLDTTDDDLLEAPPRPPSTGHKEVVGQRRENFIWASSMAMALASPGPIQIGSIRSPSLS